MDGWMEEGSGCNSKDDNNPFFVHIHSIQKTNNNNCIKTRGTETNGNLYIHRDFFLTKTLVAMQCKNKRRGKKKKMHNNLYSYLATFRVLSYFTAIMEKNRQITGYVIGIGSEYKPKVNITISQELI